MGLSAKMVTRKFKLGLGPLFVEVYPSERLAGRKNLRYGHNKKPESIIHKKVEWEFTIL